MAEKSMIVIGAGLAGLSAGVFARKAGFQTTVFEHHSLPGGVAATWRRGEYIFDGGIHFLMGCQPDHPVWKLYQELGAAEGLEVAPIETYTLFVDEESATSISVTSDLEKLRRDLISLSPQDKKPINDLIDCSLAMTGAALGDGGFSKPWELMTPFDNAKMLWQMRGMLKFLPRGLGQSVMDWCKKLQSPTLRRLIMNLFLPEVPVWFLCMLLSLLHTRNLGYLKNGAMDFARRIEQHFCAIRGEVRYHSTVSKILVENDRAVGVTLTDGSEHRADCVISAADGYSTIFEALDGRYVSKSLRTKYDTWKPIRPIVQATFGVNKTYTNESLMALALEHPIELGSSSVKNLWVRTFNYSGHFAPEGKTVVQAMFDTEWDWWNDQSNDEALYSEAKKQVADEVLARLAPYFEDIAETVEETDVATPHTLQRYTLNRQGSYMGWLPTPKAIMSRAERTLPGLSNFAMAGHWVTPGGGVPPVLASGKHAVQILRHKAKI